MNETETNTLTIGSITNLGDEFKVVTPNGLSTLSMPVDISNGGTVTAQVNTSATIRTNYDPFNVEDFLDEHIMNRVTVDHKVQEQELMKLRETAPDYANEIKENIAKNLARDISKKTSYTKKHDKNADVHHFIGRIWAFTEEELKALLLEARNV